MNIFSNFDFDFKVIVLGHISTGKSSFVSRLTQDIYIENPISTNNVQFYEKRMIITYENGQIEEFNEKKDSTVNNNDNYIEEEDSSLTNIQTDESNDDHNKIQTNDKEKNDNKFIVRLKIWDTAGAERYMSITQSYLRESNIILLFFDISCRDSFLDLDKHWWQMLADGGYIETSAILLICNKCDLKQAVTDEEIQDFCEKHNHIMNIKVSPKEGTNVTKTIHLALQEYFKMNKCSKLVSGLSKKVDLGEPLNENNELIDDSHQEQSTWGYWCKC